MYRCHGKKDYRRSPGGFALGALLVMTVALTIPTIGSAADPDYESQPEKFVKRAEQYATTDAEREVRDEGDIEISGVVIDRTKTPTGRRFYQEFTADWIENLVGDIARTNLVIQERPARSSSSILTIRDDQNDLLFNTVLTPRIVGIKETAEAAAQQVRQVVTLKALAEKEGGLEDDDLVSDGY